jgi:hypothetical protein
MNYLLKGRLKCVPALTQNQPGPLISLPEGQVVKIILTGFSSDVIFKCPILFCEHKSLYDIHVGLNLLQCNNSKTYHNDRVCV